MPSLLQECESCGKDVASYQALCDECAELLSVANYPAMMNELGELAHRDRPPPPRKKSWRQQLKGWFTR